MNKKLARRDLKLTDALQKLTESQEKSKLFKTKLDELKDDKIKLRKRVHYLYSKLSQVTVNQSTVDGKDALQTELGVLTNKVEDLEKGNRELQQLG